MPVISEAERLPTLELLGLSPQLLAIAKGEDLPPLLQHTCDPIYKVYLDGDEHLGEYGPAGFVAVPLWENDTTITAVREDPDGLTFFDYDLEDEHLEVSELARTEQGLWTHLFLRLIERGHGEPAKLALDVGFRHFPWVEARYLAAFHSTWDQRLALMEALVADIDELEAPRQPRP